ncbi:hypothetical protein [Paraburkholderia fungorum]|uniref:hypothetical protein n=1 Tax=Paraburkholderia fungorum TaxID=134537 RepID=UPI003D6BDD7C
MARTKSPPVNSVSQGAVIFKFACIDPATEVWFFTSTVALTDGTSGDGVGWAGKGSLCVRTDTGKLYVNGGTIASPTWKLVTSAA